MRLLRNEKKFWGLLPIALCFGANRSKHVFLRAKANRMICWIVRNLVIIEKVVMIAIYSNHIYKKL